MAKAAEIDEEAYQMRDSMTEKYLKSHPPKDSSSTMEMWRLREEAKRIAEEVIYVRIKKALSIEDETDISIHISS